MAKKDKKVLPADGWGLDYLPADNVLIPYRLLREHIVRYIFASQFTANRVVLDVACGSGYGAGYLARKGARLVIGGDRAAGAIYEAVRYYKKDGPEFALLDATRLPYRDGSFDVMISFETIEHIAEYEKFLGECRRVLRNNSTFICSTPNVRVPGAEKAINPYHINEFSSEQLYQILSCYFEDVRLLGQGSINRERPGAKQKLADFVRTRLLWVPYIDRLINLVTRFVFTEFRLVALGEVDDFDSYWDESVKPLPLEDYPFQPGVVTAIARK
jgi:ubiquinone/menaquinone biosynthesis C-methylase UbiE